MALPFVYEGDYLATRAISLKIKIVEAMLGRAENLFFPKIQPVAKVKKVPINNSQVHPRGNICFSERINRTSMPRAERVMATTLTRLHRLLVRRPRRKTPSKDP